MFAQVRETKLQAFNHALDGFHLRHLGAHVVNIKGHKLPTLLLRHGFGFRSRNSSSFFLALEPNEVQALGKGNVVPGHVPV